MNTLKARGAVLALAALAVTLVVAAAASDASSVEAALAGVNWR